MSKSKQLSLRELRGKRTLKEVSEGSGVPVMTYSALEKGWGRNYAPAIKHRVADYFGVNFFRTFPEERLRLEAIMRPEARRLMLAEYLPDLRFQDEGSVSDVFNAATLDEVDEIFHSGTSAKEALSKLTKLAKKYNLPTPVAK
jgi:transcriptional regulator with XRE-family HTH domain